MTLKMKSDQQRRILVVDDDRKLCGLIRDYLTPLGYEVAMKHTGAAGLEAALAGNFDAVLLDVMMPEMDGFEMLKELRKSSNVPVLMLTAMGEEADRIVGLEIGADDYLPKTFSTRELLARLRAVMRRSVLTVSEAATQETEYEVNGLQLNEGTHQVHLDGEQLTLTALEFAILASLMRSRGRVKSREQLLDDVSDRKFDVFDRSIDVHMSALRKKLGDNAAAPRFIRTIRGIGYQFIVSEGGSET
ncbi:response regulator transcription factor [Verrucomicrobiaceae bacterium R5-34]|uniref:Response regulator transcription factor n=1 Tax=Oceaniferula flava TaxID=2800421 RepID=A0AAE2SG31_9BACT|nr:response regulator transcription factor [Oceaniferula flavus]MBK1832112.1 response regulator transcription factor [Verrucomicrobiaceae bacterium R5-34]MBK1856224.1 response regulator transcription factor [Oceaniferula flavus]MBM1137531.1 response regulator transcription factor [Oceaniferula flavus]